ncbi:hypothetical protein BDV28DRAFT_144779 [Aspergillus coremiiformis]|uniref:Uncharacterized protein n=1 Tax=Aspergillus coremiiformis TaxID=138285 RepID=A0A5N6ZIU3_9EURO|nr:hypothetical protein BDV28DRAFT_144779 [Aspergillus coremiiformis]
MTDTPTLHTFKAHAKTAVAAGGAVYAADQLIKSFDDDDDDSSTTSHLLKAAVGAAVAVGALEMLNHDEHLPSYRRLFKKKYEGHSSSHEHSRSYKEEDVHTEAGAEVTDTRLVRKEQRSGSSSRSSSVSSHESGHKRRLAEELIGAYSLGKQLLGDKKHQVAHLVADAVGAAALLKEIKHHDLRNL